MLQITYYGLLWSTMSLLFEQVIFLFHIFAFQTNYEAC